MKIREVEILIEARDDLLQGRAFYDFQSPSVGDYFVESVLGDLGALRLYAGTLPGLTTDSTDGHGYGAFAASQRVQRCEHGQSVAVALGGQGLRNRLRTQSRSISGLEWALYSTGWLGPVYWLARAPATLSQTLDGVLLRDLCGQVLAIFTLKRFESPSTQIRARHQVTPSFAATKRLYRSATCEPGKVWPSPPAAKGYATACGPSPA